MAPSRHVDRAETSLIRSAKAGDAQAIEELVMQFWPRAYRIAYLLLQNREAAEDIAQDALLRAVRGLRTFDAERPFAPWLNRITANCAHDALRARNRQFELLGVGVETRSGAEAEDLADEIAQYAFSAELEKGLAELNSDMREAVVLRHLLEYTPEEIAELVGVPAATVRTRIHRGLTALRAVLVERKEEAVD